MTPEEIEAVQDRSTILDVREPYEFAAGHIEGSVHIPLLQLQERISELDAGRPVVCVCQVGQRSAEAARFLTTHGVEAHNLDGGLTEWVASGRELVGGEGPGEIVTGWARHLEI